MITLCFPCPLATHSAVCSGTALTHLHALCSAAACFASACCFRCLPASAGTPQAAEWKAVLVQEQSRGNLMLQGHRRRRHTTLHFLPPHMPLLSTARACAMFSKAHSCGHFAHPAVAASPNLLSGSSSVFCSVTSDAGVLAFCLTGPPWGSGAPWCCTKGSLGLTSGVHSAARSRGTGGGSGGVARGNRRHAAHPLCHLAPARAVGG